MESPGGAEIGDASQCEQLLELGEEELHRAPKVALDKGRRVLELTRGLDNEHTVRALQLTGSAHLRAGDLRAAKQDLSRALELQQRMERGGIAEASICQRLADVQLAIGRLDHALERCESAGSIAEAHGDRALVGAGLATRGFVRHRQGRVAEARESLSEALDIAREEEDIELELQAHIGIAQLEAQEGDSAHALERLHGVLARARETGHSAMAVMALNSMALVHNRLQASEETLRFADDARRSAQEIGARFLEAEALRIKHGGLRLKGDLEEAVRCAVQSAELHGQAGANVAQANALSGLADLHLAQEEFEKAREVSEQVLAIATECGYAFGRFIAWHQIGRYHTARAEYGKALEALDEALEAATTLGDHIYIGAVHEAASEAYSALGEPERALKRFRLFHEHTIEGRRVASEQRIESLRVRHEVAQAQREVNGAVKNLKKSEAFASSVLDSLRNQVAVLDSTGKIIAVNERWHRSGLASGASDTAIGIGADYVGVCRSAEGAGSEDAHHMLTGILQVMEGGRSAFTHEYKCSTPDGDRWFDMRVTPLAGAQGGVVISHQDTTVRKESELQLEEALAEVQALKDRLEAENLYLSEEIHSDRNFDEIVGRSSAMKGTFDLVDRVAPTDVTILLLGETGTGKELFARAIHARSARKDRPMVKVDCAALPSGLIENELLGHEKGAFTGAHSAKPGRFELADGGTIFLDEIGELPLDLQVKLLRVLEDGEFERLGSGVVRRVDVRVIAATNRDLEQAVERGGFRADLYYRLNNFPIELPPLRERAGDIPLLARHFIEKSQGRFSRRIEKIPRESMEALERYPWPGNVRELASVVERAMILSNGPTLAAPQLSEPKAVSGSGTLEKSERAHILSALNMSGWRIKGAGNAAERLGLPASTLRHRMKKLGIQRPS